MDSTEESVYQQCICLYKNYNRVKCLLRIEENDLKTISIYDIDDKNSHLF